MMGKEPTASCTIPHIMLMWCKYTVQYLLLQELQGMNAICWWQIPHCHAASLLAHWRIKILL